MSATEPSPDRVFSRSFLLLIGLCFVAGGLYGWSAVIPALQSVFLISTEAAGAVFSTAIVAFSVTVYAVPRLPRSARDARAASLFGLAGAICLAVAASANSFPLFLAAFAVGFGGASGAIYVICISAAAETDRPFLATPIAVAAFGLGGATFGPGMRFLVGFGWGLEALHILAASLALLSIAGLMFVPRHVVETSPESTAQAAKRVNGAAIPVTTIALLFCTFAAGSFAGLMTLGLATPILESRGAGLWLSSATLFGVAIGNTGGRLSVSLLTRTYSPGVIVAASPVIAGVGGLLALFSSTPLLAGLALTVIAGGYGVMASGLPSLTRAFTGPYRFGRVFSVVFIAWGLAGLVSPWIAGRLFDMTQTFAAAFVVAVVASVVAFLTAIALLRQARRNHS